MFIVSSNNIFYIYKIDSNAPSFISDFNNLNYFKNLNYLKILSFFHSQSNFKCVNFVDLFKEQPFGFVDFSLFFVFSISFVSALLLVPSF